MYKYINITTYKKGYAYRERVESVHKEKGENIIIEKHSLINYSHLFMKQNVFLIAILNFLPFKCAPSQTMLYLIEIFIYRFWYVSIVACYQNVSTCTWHYYDYRKFNHAHAPVIKFDLYLVNGNPKQTAAENVFDSTISPLEYHFSFDQQYILQMYLIFFAIYLVLVPLQIAAARLQKHPVTRLFTISLTLEFISLCFMLGHWIRYAFDGVGNENLSITGSIFDIFSRVNIDCEMHIFYSDFLNCSNGLNILLVV